MSGMNELIRMLQGYLSGAAGLGEFAEWLAGVDWDDAAMTEEQREGLGTFELLLTEVAEGLRGEREFFEEASRFVASRPQSVCTGVQNASARRPAMSADNETRDNLSRQIEDIEPGVSALVELYELIESVYVTASQASSEMQYAVTSNSTNRE
jgi:hypothetical protein